LKGNEIKGTFSTRRLRKFTLREGMQLWRDWREWRSKEEPEETKEREGEETNNDDVDAVLF
jgi:hypothetical protein